MTPPIRPGDLIDPKVAAKLLGVTPSTVRRWLSSGKLRGWRVGFRFRVSKAEVLALIQPVCPDAPVEEARPAPTQRYSRFG